MNKRQSKLIATMRNLGTCELQQKHLGTAWEIAHVRGWLRVSLTVRDVMQLMSAGILRKRYEWSDTRVLT